LVSEIYRKEIIIKAISYDDAGNLLFFSKKTIKRLVLLKYSISCKSTYME